jgi:uncharacterized protein (TIGR02391 family)
MNTKQSIINLKEIDKLIKDSGLSTSKSHNTFYDLCVELLISPEIRKGCLKLFKDGHNALAVETAFKLINNYVKSLSGLNKLDGMPLMQTAFSIGNAKIKLNKLETTSDKDEQLGYMNIFAGCMTGIRNPRAHEHDFKDSERTTFELLILSDHLMQKLKAIQFENTKLEEK